MALASTAPIVHRSYPIRPWPSRAPALMQPRARHSTWAATTSRRPISRATWPTSAARRLPAKRHRGPVRVAGATL